MQNVVHNSKCDSPRDSELNEVGKDHSGSSSPLSGNISVERRTSAASLGTHFMAELSESDDDDVSEVCFFKAWFAAVIYHNTYLMIIVGLICLSPPFCPVSYNYHLSPRLTYRNL